MLARSTDSRVTRLTAPPAECFFTLLNVQRARDFSCPTERRMMLLAAAFYSYDAAANLIIIISTRIRCNTTAADHEANQITSLRATMQRLIKILDP